MLDHVTKRFILGEPGIEQSRAQSTECRGHTDGRRSRHFKLVVASRRHSVLPLLHVMATATSPPTLRITIAMRRRCRTSPSPHDVAHRHYAWVRSVAIGHKGSILSSDDVAPHRLTLLLMWSQTSLSRRSDFQKGRTLADSNSWVIKGKPL